MVKFVVKEFRRLILAVADGGRVLGFIHVEFVLAVNVVAEVRGQVRDVRDLYFEVKLLVKKVRWIFWQVVFVKVFVAVLVAWDNIDVNLSINLMICGDNWNDSGVVNHVSKTLEHVESLSQKNGLLFLKEWVMIWIKLLKQVVFVVIQCRPHHLKLIVELVT